MPNPLFPNFNKLLNDQKAALRKWRAIEASLVKAARTGNVPRFGQPMRYGAGNWLWQNLIKSMGPIGDVISALLRPTGGRLANDIQSELDAAQQLLEAFGYNVNKPGQGTAAKPLPEILRELVEESPEPKPAKPSGRPDRTKPTTGEPEPAEPEPRIGQSEDAVDSPTGLREGMIPVRSSNVHSIGWEWADGANQRTGGLLVRFLGGTGSHRSGPGAMYRYRDVPRSVFDAFKRAASKGKFVWDELRVRGSISGHQYDYELAAIEGEYVPRQAVVGFRGRGGEAYVPRNFQGRRSTLPAQQVRGSGGRNLTKDFKGEASKLAFRGGRRNP